VLMCYQCADRDSHLAGLPLLSMSLKAIRGLAVCAFH
jgi:hypothetical protein